MSVRISRVAAAVRRPWGASLALVAVAIGVHLVPSVAAHLEYDRAAIAAGEIWRLITCHWTHWSLSHLVWDVVSFWVLYGAIAARSHARVAGCLAAAALAISLGVWILQPELEHYRGLSGLDAALAALTAVSVVREPATSRGARLAGCALLVGLGAKIAFELASGTAVFVDTGAAGVVPVPLAHVIGAVIGSAFGLRPWSGPLSIVTGTPPGTSAR